ncbi:hypothetical protein [Microbacterium sp. Leaf320]|uniref:hypothetical protein n=1 Tax=Microbacterium sp. Leaf320 TaxID=1736334 RepID=UPI0006FC3BA5|nr:hypothetical protein [Microbacterium sp. Leaf320]KQQ68934.1 hypothetical protein ASF63_02850 [Microbacterium sp. Leaf320]
MTSRQLRLLRAASASAVATLLAATSHTVAGGAAPHPLLVISVMTLVVPIAALIIGGRASRLRVAATVLVSQAAFHVVFQLLGTPTGTTVLSGHQHHLDLSALSPMAAATAPDLLMVNGHLGAAVITTALVWHGESMVRAVAGWVKARLRRAATAFRPSHRLPAPPVVALPLLVDRALSTSLSRRGPPAIA